MKVEPLKTSSHQTKYRYSWNQDDKSLCTERLTLRGHKCQLLLYEHMKEKTLHKKKMTLKDKLRHASVIRSFIKPSKLALWDAGLEHLVIPKRGEHKIHFDEDTAKWKKPTQ